VPDSKPEVDNVTPLGRAPVSVNVGAGKPVVVTWKVAGLATIKVAFSVLVIDGCWPIVRVKV
jgi:hypothetical protein